MVFWGLAELKRLSTGNGAKSWDTPERGDGGKMIDKIKGNIVYPICGEAAEEVLAHLMSKELQLIVSG